MKQVQAIMVDGTVATFEPTEHYKTRTDIHAVVLTPLDREFEETGMQYSELVVFSIGDIYGRASGTYAVSDEFTGDFAEPEKFYLDVVDFLQVNERPETSKEFEEWNVGFEAGLEDGGML